MKNLVAHNLACERNGRVVFSNLSFTLASGQCAELRGPNGAGKSSLLRMIASLVPKAGGSLAFNGSEDFATNLHFIAHQDAMKPALSVAENLEFWNAVLGGSGIAAGLAAFRLETLRNDPVQLLSAGQRRRLTLARLFLGKRALWLLDEPMTALDIQSQDSLRGHIRAHLRDGGLVVAATHGDFGITANHTITLGQA